MSLGKSRSKMKCEGCGERPVWHVELDDNLDPICECGLCHHQQQPRVTKAKIARMEARAARHNTLMASLET